ncbi:hypothetical protein EAF00_004712 [Botryotinia globosa]|nr:hypothetical protein EAF00_004712 [Botryotinia globosa]
MKSLSSDFQVYIYHGDERESRSGTHKKIAGKLTRRHPISDGEEKNSRVMVITTLITLRNRHGPSALKTQQVFSSISSPTKPYTQNADTMPDTSVTWLEPSFQLLATATVLSNRIDLVIFSLAFTICIAVALSEKLL